LTLVNKLLLFIILFIITIPELLKIVQKGETKNATLAVCLLQRKEGVKCI